MCLLRPAAVLQTHRTSLATPPESALHAVWPLRLLLPLWSLLDLPGSTRQALAGAVLVCAAHAVLLRLLPTLLPMASQAASQAVSLGSLSSRRATTDEGHDGVRCAALLASSARQLLKLFHSAQPALPAKSRC